MKKLLAILMAMAMLFAFVGCNTKKDDNTSDKKGSTAFECQNCGEASTGKEYTIEANDEEYTICKDCYDLFNEDDEGNNNNRTEPEKNGECELCYEEINGSGNKVEEDGETYTLCDECYEIYLELLEEYEGEADECFACGTTLDSDEGYDVVDEDLTAALCDDCFDEAVESGIADGCSFSNGFVFDEDGTVIGEYSER